MSEPGRPKEPVEVFERWSGREDLVVREAVLEREVAVACEVAQDGFEATGAKSRLFQDWREWSPLLNDRGR